MRLEKEGRQALISVKVNFKTFDKFRGAERRGKGGTLLFLNKPKPQDCFVYLKKYERRHNRNTLSKNRGFFGGFFKNDSLSFEAGVKLSEDEIAFDKKLARLRKQIVEKAGEQSLDLNNKSFEEIKPFAESGKLYEILKRMPKGGLLHSHSGGLTDIKWVIETAKKYEECYVFLQSDGKDYIFGQLAFFKTGTAPQGFVSLRRKILEEPPFENKLYELLTLKRKTLCA